MNIATLTRWSGLAAIVGGLLYSLYWIFHPLVPSIVANPSGYTAEHLVGLLGQALTLLGLIGIYARLAERTGWLGLIGFLLVFVGVLSFFAVTATDAFVWPALATNPASRALILTSANEFDQASVVFNSNSALIGVGLIGIALGGIVMGIAVMRSNALPRWAGALLLIGSPLLALGPGLPLHDSFPVNILYFAPFGLALVWLGWATFKGQ
jgi:hypothetical protein